MKKYFTILLLFSFYVVFAQLPVSQIPGKKKVLIEDFTGNKCQGCPSGAKSADQIIAANPGKVFAICIHSSGNFSEPDTAASAKDFRTPDGDAIRNIPGIGITAYPAGMVNRIAPTYPQTTGGLAFYHGFWAAETATLLNQNSYVNLAGQAFVHPITRQMIVNIEAYYTANCPVPANRLTVALIQDNIIAFQKGKENYPAMVVGNDYRHNHALRDIITTSALGDNISGSKTAGTTYSRTINYTVSQTYPASGSKTIPAVLADLQLIAFIAETDRNIITTCKIPITITTSTDIFSPVNNNLWINNVNVYPNPIVNTGAAVFTITKESAVAIEIVNTLGQVVKSDKLDVLGVGEHKYEFDVINLTNGIYFLNINVDGNITTKKISVLK